jgi:hypothetical protein
MLTESSASILRAPQKSASSAAPSVRGAASCATAAARCVSLSFPPPPTDPLQCLKSAWDTPRLPHKTLCKTIIALRAEAGLSDDKAWNHTVRDSQQKHRSPIKFAELCAERGVDLRLADAVVIGLHMLGDMKEMFLIEREEKARAAREEAEVSEEGGRESGAEWERKKGVTRRRAKLHAQTSSRMSRIRTLRRRSIETALASTLLLDTDYPARMAAESTWRF